MTGRFRVNRRDVPVEGGLRRDEGWVDMQVQFLVDQARAGSEDLLLGWTVLPPGARHDKHRHPNADEFFIVLSGRGMVYTDDEDQPAEEGDVLFTRRGHWHGFNNTGNDDVTLVWGWSGAGSLEAAGYELPE
jgi:quercetin dioxygenase-like cupin family protein